MNKTQPIIMKNTSFINNGLIKIFCALNYMRGYNCYSLIGRVVNFLAKYNVDVYTRDDTLTLNMKKILQKRLTFLSQNPSLLFVQQILVQLFNYK